MLEKKYKFLYLIAVLLLLSVWFSNWLITQYQFPPGIDDVVYHSTYPLEIQDGQYTNYPFFYHLLIITLSLIDNVDITKINLFLPLFFLSFLIPSILFIIFRLEKKILTALPFIVGLPIMMVEICVYGQLPELMAITLLTFLIYLFFKKKFFLGFCVIPIIFLTHHLTTVVLIPSVIFLFILLLFFSKKKIFFIALPLALLFFYFFIDYFFPYYIAAIETYLPKLSTFFSPEKNIYPLIGIFGFLKLNYLYAFFGLIGFIFFIPVIRKRLYLAFIPLFIFFSLLLSQIDLINCSISQRLIRDITIPFLILCMIGFINLLKYCNRYVKITILALILIINITFLTKAINNLYSAYYFERVKPRDYQAIEFIKKNSSQNAVILMPAESATWFDLLSSRKFMFIIKSSPQDGDEIKWQLLNGEITDRKILDPLNIDYIYLAPPFANVDPASISINENSLIQSKLWQKIYDQNDVRIYRYIYSFN